MAGSKHERILADLLACPDCGAALTWAEGTLRDCSKCGRSFSMSGNVPLLYPSNDQSTETAGRQFFVDEPGRFARLRTTHPLIARLAALPDFTVATKALPECAGWFRSHVQATVEGERILNLGSGVDKVYSSPNIVNFDIAAHTNVDVVGDGERLPFRNASFDGVVLDAVIEHLPHPRRVVDEVHRVLKTGGVALAHVPFLFPYHAAPHDYQRYTPAGLATLFEEFEVIEAGTDRRPGRAVLEVMTAYAAAFSDNRTISYALRWLTAWIWLPIKFLDHWLSRKAKADYVVASSSILARKRLTSG